VACFYDVVQFGWSVQKHYSRQKFGINIEEGTDLLEKIYIKPKERRMLVVCSDSEHKKGGYPHETELN
jgi:hypothetical protein